MKWKSLLVLTSTILLSIFLLTPSALANDVTVPTTLHFGIPEYSGYISFDEAQTFDEVKRESSYWYFDDYGFQMRNGNMTVTNLFAEHDELEFRVSAASGVTSTSKVVVGTAKGKPHKVFIDNIEHNEGIYWTYDGPSNTLIITWTHASPAVVKVTWKGSGMGLYNLHVYVTQGGYPASAILNVRGINYTAYALHNFELPRGTYDVICYCGDHVKTKRVGLFGDTTIGFSFEVDYRNPWLWGVPLLIIFVAAVFLFIRKR